MSTMWAMESLVYISTRNWWCNLLRTGVCQRLLPPWQLRPCGVVQLVCTHTMWDVGGSVLGIVMRATYDILVVGTERQAMLRMLSAQSESNGSIPLLLPLCKAVALHWGYGSCSQSCTMYGANAYTVAINRPRFIMCCKVTAPCILMLFDIIPHHWHNDLLGIIWHDLTSWRPSQIPTLQVKPYLPTLSLLCPITPSGNLSIYRLAWEAYC